MDKQEERRGWHMDKRLSISHLLTTLAILTGVMVWGMRLESRTAVIEKTVEIQTSTTQQQLTDIKNSLARIENRLDGKVDR